MDRNDARDIARQFLRRQTLAAAAAATICDPTGRNGDTSKVVRLLYHRDPAVRAAAVKNLTKARSSEHTPHFLQALNDRDPRVRIAACDALGQLRAIPAKAKLYDALNDRAEDVRCAAAVALAVMGDKYGLLPIARLVCKQSDHQLTALKALNSITKQKFPLTRSGLRDAIRWIKLSGKAK